MVRHVFMTGAISPAARGMVEAAGPAHLIAPSGLAPPHPAGLAPTVCGAVDLAPIAAAADQHLLSAKGAEKEAAAGAVLKVATDRDVAISRHHPVDAIRVRRQYAPAIVLRHGVGRGAELKLPGSSVGAAPGLSIRWTLASPARRCQRPGAILKNPPPDPHPRVDPMGPQATSRPLRFAAR